jgi:hypothetical protein
VRTGLDIPLRAFAGMRLTHVQSFGWFDEIAYFVEKTSDLTLTDLGGVDLDLKVLSASPNMVRLAGGA